MFSIRTRVLLGLGVGLVLIFGLGLFANRRAMRTFEMWNRFGDLIEAEQFSEAELMIRASDRPKMPPEFWDQFRGQKVMVLSAPLGQVFLGGPMAGALAVERENGSGDGCGVSFVVDGNEIWLR